MAVKDGSGPRPAAHTAKRCFLNCLEASFKHIQFACLPALLAANLLSCSCSWPYSCAGLVKALCFLLPTCVHPLAAGFRPAQLRKGPPRKAKTPWQSFLLPPALLVPHSLMRSPCCRQGRRICSMHANKLSQLKGVYNGQHLQCIIENLQPPKVTRPPDGGKPHQLWAVEDRRSRLLVRAGPFPCIGLDFWIPAWPNYGLNRLSFHEVWADPGMQPSCHPAGFKSFGVSAAFHSPAFFERNFIVFPAYTIHFC